jgi:thymidylate synthase
MYHDTTSTIRNAFIEKYQYSDFTVGRGGHKMLEIIGASFKADQPTIIGVVNQHYVEKEIAWYESMSTNINDIYLGEKEPPAAWRGTADRNGNINSNYGHLIWSEKYFSQYWNVCRELNNNPESRRATMVYTRPSIWVEYNEDGKSDFICTNAVTYYIRDHKVHAVVQMRSNDVVFGYKNDYAWQRYLLEKLTNDLIGDAKAKYTPGDIYWQVQNLHIYGRHFQMLEEYTG